MRAVLATSLILTAALALPAAADTTTTASGAGANVSIVSGSNGGTTIIVDSDKPCRTETRTGANSSRGSTSARVDTGAGGLSGSTSAGPNGITVQLGSGHGSSSASTDAGGQITNQAKAGECVIVIEGPKAK